MAQRIRLKSETDFFYCDWKYSPKMSMFVVPEVHVTFFSPLLSWFQIMKGFLLSDYYFCPPPP